MNGPSTEFEGQIQAGGQASGNPWAQATLTRVGDEVVLVVNRTEVARLAGPKITDTGQNDVFLIEGGDQPLFFRPRDPAAFRTALALPLTTAERIAAASAQPDDATMVMERPPEGSEPGPGEGGVEEKPPSRPWWLVAVLGGLAIVALIAFCGGEEEAGTSSTTIPLVGTSTTVPDTVTTTTTAATTTTLGTTTTLPETTTTTAATTTVPAPEPAFGPGTHVVGEDIEAGVYETGIVEGLFGCYWERLSGLSGDFEEIIANGNVTNHDAVEVVEGDAAFSTDCDAWYPLTPLDPPLTSIPEGKWVLGVHIDSGTYETPGGDSCYWERLSGLSGDLADIIANDLAEGQAVVEIADDDVAFNSTGCGEWTPRS